MLQVQMAYCFMGGLSGLCQQSHWRHITWRDHTKTLSTKIQSFINKGHFHDSKYLKDSQAFWSQHEDKSRLNKEPIKWWQSGILQTHHLWMLCYMQCYWKCNLTNVSTSTLHHSTIGNLQHMQLNFKEKCEKLIEFTFVSYYKSSNTTNTDDVIKADTTPKELGPLQPLKPILVRGQRRRSKDPSPILLCDMFPSLPRPKGAASGLTLQTLNIFTKYKGHKCLPSKSFLPGTPICIFPKGRC